MAWEILSINTPHMIIGFRSCVRLAFSALGRRFPSTSCSHCCHCPRHTTVSPPAPAAAICRSGCSAALPRGGLRGHNRIGRLPPHCRCCRRPSWRWQRLSRHMDIVCLGPRVELMQDPHNFHQLLQSMSMHTTLWDQVGTLSISNMAQAQMD